MDKHQVRRLVVRALCAVGASAVLVTSPPAAADIATYQFTLEPSYGWEYVGSGYFTVDETMVPDSGSFMSLASDLGGELVTGRKFGYAFGNENLKYLGGDPADPQNSILIRTPHNDAVITFEDGVPVGIAYVESHTCSVAYHCFPNHEIRLLGGTYYVFDYPRLGAFGDLTISPIPEPSTLALMLGGLGALVLVRRRGDRRRSRAGAPAPT